ncbi:MAG TPA: DedA family protein [Fimbriimonas sp.]|nr:DedA family protein [Fimbriimonas sp.]
MIDWLRHIDKNLIDLIQQYGVWVYAILSGIIFAETAVVIFPFLPGDSLLFAVGMIAADEKKGLSLPGMFFLLTAAAIGGNIVNYWIGRFFGQRCFKNPNAKFFSQKNLAKTHEFFDNYGGKAIIITRFVPVVRAFAPFVAGMGAMEFPKFMIYNVISGFVWVGVCMFAGALLGGIPQVKDNFEIAIMVLIVISVLPIAVEVWLHKRRKKKAIAAAAQEESSSS